MGIPCIIRALLEIKTVIRSRADQLPPESVYNQPPYR